MFRLLAATPFAALALLFLMPAWNPLGNGYFADYRDSPTGLYLTIAGIGLTLAALFGAIALTLAWPAFASRGGLLLTAALAVVASVLPYVLFKWTTEPETWPWAHLVQDAIGWLRFDGRPRSDGLAIQFALAIVAVGSVALHFALRGKRQTPCLRAGGETLA